MHPQEVRKQVLDLVENNTTRFCVVFDLDDTLLRIDRQSKEPLEVFDLQKSARAPAILELVNLYQELQNKSKLLILTARPRCLEDATRCNLSRVGINKPKIFFTKNKACIRSKETLPIINIGDRDRDFVGGYWTYGFRVSP